MAQQRIKIPTFVRENPIASATFSKLNQARNGLNKVELESLLTDLPAVAQSTYARIQNNDTILELFPDVELAMQIVVSSIVSPNDLITVNSRYISPNLKIPEDIKASLANTIKNHIEDNYHLDDILYEDLKEVLFTRGGLAYGIIPEAAVDDAINPDFNGQITVESITNFYTKTSILGLSKPLICSIEEDRTGTALSSSNNKRFTVSSVQPDKPSKDTATVTEDMLGIQIIDNPSYLNLANLRLDRIHKNVSSKIPGYLGTEAYEDKIKQQEVDLDLLFKPNDRLPEDRLKRINTVDTASRRSLGKPMVIKFPIESVIPVYTLNDVTKHLGYFILLDEQGAPINIEGEIETCETGGAANMINKAKQALYGIIKEDTTLDNMESIYGQLVERMIKDKLRNGQYGDIVDIKEDADIYRVMFYRALKAQNTKILFLPAELVAFYAFKYRDNGTGKSLLEENAILFSLRAILLFSKLMATVKNSITITDVAVEMDEQIADPVKMKDVIMSEVLKTRQAQLPIGVTKIDDIVDWIHKVGFRFKFTHPGLPNLDINVTDVNSNKVIPDDSLDEELRKMQYMSFGLTPEIVEAGYSSDFATTVAAKNLLFAKRISVLQARLNVMRTIHVRKLIKSDMFLQEKLRSILESNFKDIYKYVKDDKIDVNETMDDFDGIKRKEMVEYVISKYANEIWVELPKTQMTEADAMKASYEAYKDALTDYLDTVLSDQGGFPSAIAGKLGENIESIKSMVMSVFLRKWMADNNYMQEVTDFLSLREDGKPVFDAFADYNMVYTTLSESFLAWYKDYKKERAKVDDKLDKLLGDSMDSYSSDTGDMNSDTGESDMGSDLDMGNMGDLEEEPTEGSEEGNEPNEEGTEPNNEEGTEDNNPEA